MTGGGGLGIDVDPSALSAESRSWSDWVELMTSTRSETNEQKATGFSPDVAPQARAFLASWVDLTTTMRDRVETISDGLGDAGRTWRATDDGVGEGYTQRDD
ncbi:MAG TPA: hypothetical protein VIR30_19880 [Nocardioides sp.]|uniref:Uncharacterized protein n=1 Tax=Nocardioides daedukensis TaxID=634462 RepID=A0A7Y9S1W9_9ACTN|nr:hypothetical protein [Nocardioides daedukensis]NYG58643.1 hypothetical protein [Nocardioides daedukensis]